MQQNFSLLKKQKKLNFYRYKMAQYNSLRVKLSNSQLNKQHNKLKSAIKIKTEVVLRLSSNAVGNSHDGTNLLKNCCYLIDKLQIFVELLKIIHQLILSYQKLNYLR